MAITAGGNLNSVPAPIKQTLQNGSLLIMNPPTQELWEHSIPKRKNAGTRINLTFRNVI